MWLPSLGSCGCKPLAAHFQVDMGGEGGKGRETQETHPPLHLQTSRFSLGRLVYAVSTVPVSFLAIPAIYYSFSSTCELLNDPASL